jgi:ABC-type sugar transport system permease subunit
MKKRNRPREVILTYLWMLPAIVLILVFLVIPTIQTIALSFTRTVKVSEAAILGTIERAIRGPGKSGGPDVSAPVRSFPAWKNALESLDAVYGIRIR